ncbi:MAG: endonuclease/exonuclease/phosphatase family protein [bacterium]
MKRIFILFGILGSIVIAIFVYINWGQKEERISYFSNIRDVKLSISRPYYTFMTYNIQLGFNRYSDPWDKKQIGGTEDNLMHIVKAIKSVDPDVVALQEVAKDRSNTKIKTQIEFLAEKLNMNYAYGAHGENTPGGFLSRGLWGNAILSKYKILNIQNHEIFYKDRGSRRSCLEATIQFPQGPVTVFSTHFRFDDFKGEVRNTVDLIEKSINPIVLMGDFNLLPADKLLIPILEKLSDTCKKVHNENSLFVQQYGTCGNPGGKPINCPFCGKPLPFGCRIDNIFISPELFEVVDVGLIPKEYWEVSDHVAYFAQLRFKK